MRTTTDPRIGDRTAPATVRHAHEESIVRDRAAAGGGYIVFAWSSPTGPVADEWTSDHLRRFHGWSDAQARNINTDAHGDEHHGNPHSGLEPRSDLPIPHTHDSYRAVMLAIAYSEFHPDLKNALFAMIDGCLAIDGESVCSIEDWRDG